MNSWLALLVASECHVQIGLRIVVAGDRRRVGPLDPAGVIIVPAVLDPAVRAGAQLYDQDLADVVRVHDVLAVIRGRFDRVGVPVVLDFAPFYHGQPDGCNKKSAAPKFRSGREDVGKGMYDTVHGTD